MKKILLCALLCCAPIAVLAGCGGGGGGGGNGGGSPTATPIGQNTVTIQLRDDIGGIVDGLITVGAQRQATVSGQATFGGVATGTRSVSVEVNGRVTSQNITVVAGTSTVTIVIPSFITPTATSTIPPPPF